MEGAERRPASGDKPGGPKCQLNGSINVIKIEIEHNKEDVDSTPQVDRNMNDINLML
jgi:hypothetical protein